MKIIELLKSFFNKWKSSEVETFIISKKPCPHCVNRGMIFLILALGLNRKKKAQMKIINKKLILFIFFSIFFSTYSLSQTNKFVSTEGKSIVGLDGKKLLLKGINLGNWLVPEGYMFRFKKVSSPRMIYDFFNILIGEDEANKFWDSFRENYITKNDIHFIKSLGFNSVRIPFNFRLLVTEYPHRELKGVGYQLLERVVKWCREENLYVILDMHCAPGGQTGDNIDDSYGYPFLFESPESQELIVDIWKKLAETFKDESIIIGYDLMNEPIAHYFDTEEINPKLEPLFKKITLAIREVDKNHIIFLGGAQWNSNFRIFSAPFDDKLVYTFHKYWTDPTKEVIQDYIDFENKYNVPIWMGESGENTNEWINDFRTMLEENEIGWCFWPYKKMESSRGIVSIMQPDNYDLIIEFAEDNQFDYHSIRENRPDFKKVKSALFQYLENCKLKNCVINKDYIKALGL